MTNRLFLACVCCLLSTFVLAQNTQTLTPFEELILKGKIEVILEQGEENRLTIEDEDASEGELNIIRQGRTLKLSLIDGWIKDDNRPLRLRVQFQDLRQLKVTAGAVASGRGTFNLDQLAVKAGSGGQLRLDLKVGTLEAAASEGAILQLRGQADLQYASAATGGEYDGTQLICADTEVKANTGGQALVVANERLSANANTGGVIRYSGSPEEKYTKSNLAGEIRRL